MTESVITFKLPKSLLNGLSEEKREITLIILKQNEEITRLWVNNLKKEKSKYISLSYFLSGIILK